jgi:preprotein translocase subunit SecG
MDRVLPQLLRLAAALAVAFLGLLAALVVLDVIPREQLRTLGVKVVLLLGIFCLVTLVITVLLRSGRPPGQSS